MSNKKKIEEKIKVIDGVEHRGDMPKPQGMLLWLVCKCPLWSIVIMLFVFIAMEMLGFACLYKAVSLSSFIDCLNYSFFSILGETVADSVRNSMSINYIISFQVILTNCSISFFTAIFLYKLINIKPELIKMEDHLVFDPESGTLRLRITNTSRFTLTNVRIDASIRIHLPGKRRHANAKLRLKVKDINPFKPYEVWNIATKPFRPENTEETKLNVERYDSDREYEFIPDLLSEKYRSDDAEKAKRTDYNNLNLTITIKSPLFGNDLIYQKDFKAEDFVCGTLISLDPHEPDKNITKWSNWEKYKEVSESYCKECIFTEHCGIIKKIHITIS